VSGGSYNYPENLALGDPTKLVDSSDIRRMADELEKSYPDSKAAQDTRKLVDYLDSIEDAIMSMTTDALVNVWHAQEWFEDCDYGKDQVDEAVQTYETAEPAHPHCSRCLESEE